MQSVKTSFEMQTAKYVQTRHKRLDGVSIHLLLKRDNPSQCWWHTFLLSTMLTSFRTSRHLPSFQHTTRWSHQPRKSQNRILLKNRSDASIEDCGGPARTHRKDQRAAVENVSEGSEQRGHQCLTGFSRTCPRMTQTTCMLECKFVRSICCWP